ncbi:FkbM family methyltransferase [Synechocystis salina]|uniref:FkbM family methyltransferase n=1 Tax=Synechocystis salina LEGE 00031 TaxID=1828736 RepID=A0ABR9VRV6_9SYNC|nr:FkbM family methyltransferase [Synechocystis salina]MBE9241027.1 FkbM family methyltransferase [Synechocystis salina LEGE 00041]MBE9254067.1 FkbM family methyltransferase [Synechocystis salina LEGE 00031]
MINKINKIFDTRIFTFVTLIEFLKLRKIPRHISVDTKFFSQDFKIVDSCTFLEGIREIFIGQIYAFNTNNRHPLIIDCGANIGLGSIYFKQLYPQSKIIAFEPDPQIYEILKFNLDSLGMSDVQISNTAVWNQESKLSFFKEGAFSGRIAKVGDDNLIEVKTTRLKSLLGQKIDFLKIDIEGAEYPVIKDCQELLKNVERIFIEYHSHYQEKQNLHDILAILTEEGFRYHIKEAYTSQRPFIDRPLMLNFDLQLNIFATRER